MPAKFSEAIEVFEGGGKATERVLLARIIHEFVMKPPRRQARRACGATKEGSILEQYVDRLSGEPARRQACRSGVSAVVVEVFVNHAG